jgi:hypothetical protein
MAQRDGQVAADLDTRGRALGIVDWPYGVHTTAKQQAMLDWADSCQASRWIARTFARAGEVPARVVPVRG